MIFRGGNLWRDRAILLAAKWMIWRIKWFSAVRGLQNSWEKSNFAYIET